MKLTYRGVHYKEEKRNFSSLPLSPANKELIYRGNSLKARVNPRFPCIKYIKQLFNCKRVLDPITFWYNHKKKFLQACWCLDDVEKLDRSWDLTLRLERAKIVKQRPKIKLKYRGNVYYK